MTYLYDQIWTPRVPIFDKYNKAKQIPVAFEHIYSELYDTWILRTVRVCISHSVSGTAHHRDSINTC